MNTFQSVFLVTVVNLLVTPSGQAIDWNGFRGPRGNGMADIQDIPLQWSEDSNLVWKVPLPRPGNGSPIVSAGMIFVTSAEDDEGRKRSLFCLDAKTGEQRWVRTVSIDRTMPTHKTNPYCGSTPASDGERVVAWHSSAGLYCYRHSGQEIWSRQLGEFRHMWGYGASPVIHGNTVLLYCGPGEKIFVTAIDLTSGETLWQVEEPQQGNGELNTDEKYMGSWATPVVAKVKGQDQVVCSMPTRVVAYEPNTGKVLWSCGGIRGKRGDLAYSSPMIEHDLCVAVGGFQGPAIGLRLGGRGDVTGSHRLWRKEKNPQSIGTGILLDQHVYRANAGPGTIECLNANTGDVTWTARAAGADHWASVIYAGRHLLATNQDGTTVVFKANPEAFQEVNVNKLGEPTNATPAFAPHRVYLRGAQHLFCFGNR